MIKRTDILVFAVFVAAAYVCAVYVFQIGFNASKWAAYHNLNILGDSIGGLTAPLSLIFLVAAVVIQRQELILTKAELAASAQALKDQVEEQRQHREFVGQQTELMRKEAEASAENTRKAYKLSLFDRRYAIYFALRELHIKMRGGGVQWWVLADTLSDLSNRARFLFGQDVNGWFEWLREEVDQAQQLAVKINKLTGDGWYAEDDIDPAIRDEVHKGNEHLEAKFALVMANLDHGVLYKVFAASMEVTD